MDRRWWFILTLIAFFPLVAEPLPSFGGSAPPMVEKHIFSPEEVEKESPLEDKKSPVVKQIEQEIIFTGVISTLGGRRAMLSEKAVRPGKTQPELYKEGDEIRGMTIKKIGSNFIILSGKGKDVKLNLYQGTKMRPAPPALPEIAKTPEAAAGGQSASSSAAPGNKPDQKPAVQGSAQKPIRAQVGSNAKRPNPAPSSEETAPTSSNPFLEALKKAARQGRMSGGTPSSADNGFLEAIKRAQQQ
jgi:hypothetical protein